MLRVFLIAALGALALAPASSGEHSAAKVIVYATVEGDGTVVAVDAARRRVVRRVRVASGPHNIAATGDGRTVVVTSPSAGRVTVLDARLRVRRVFAGFGSPHDVALSSTGRYAYVTDEARGHLVVLDLARGRVASRTDVGARPHDLALGDLIWVTHDAASRRLTVLDVRHTARRPRPMGSIDAGGAAHDIEHAPDGMDVFLTYWSSGTVGGIDAGVPRRTLFRRRVGTDVHHLALDFFSGARLWATDNAGDRVVVLSARTGRVLATYGGCETPHHVAVLADRRAAVACSGAGTVALFGPHGRYAAVAVGRVPHGVAVSRLR